MLRTTKSSFSGVISHADNCTRESEQVITVLRGRCDLANASKNFGPRFMYSWLSRMLSRTNSRVRASGSLSEFSQAKGTAKRRCGDSVSVDATAWGSGVPDDCPAGTSAEADAEACALAVTAGFFLCEVAFFGPMRLQPRSTRLITA